MSVATQVHLHHDDPDTVGRRDRMGVVLLIVADMAFVGGLAFSYLYLRFLNTNGQWMPDGVTGADPVATWVVAGCMTVGLLALAWGVRGMRAGKPTQLVLGAGVAVIAALIALFFQYQQMRGFDFPIAERGYFSGTYASSMMTLAGANAFHLLLTIFITFGIFNRARLGKYASPESWQPRIALYWWLWVVISAALVGLMTTFLVSSPYLPSVIN